jgi:uncharacterized small protein (DUF1192 family)
MDWDDVSNPKPAAVPIGEDLYQVSIAELERRIEILRAEIARLETEAQRKRDIARAADALFKS